MLENNLPKFNAAVLDGYTLNPGDLSWNELSTLCDVKIYDNTSEKQIFEHANDCEIIFTNKVVISKEVITALPKLKYIGVLATGFNVVDIIAAKNAGIVVTNIPSYSTDSVAQLTIAFIFNFMWNVQKHSDEVHEGKWSNSKHFCYQSFPVYELVGKTLGIVGFGNIGQAVARIGISLGMNVVYSNRSRKTVPELSSAKQVELNELFSIADFITLNCPLNDATYHLINSSTLSKIKNTAYIINTARGPIVDEIAVSKALKEKTLAGYGTDVLSTEPPSADNPLLGAPNCVITPHLAWQTFEARKRMSEILVENLKSFLSGNIKNQVN
ncbi:MAG: glycerate dehydrogenase [Treponema sp.]|nr:MAG: glycerate dehydrogenase [Treponema sp.]